MFIKSKEIIIFNLIISNIYLNLSFVLFTFDFYLNLIMNQPKRGSSYQKQNITGIELMD